MTGDQFLLGVVIACFAWRLLVNAGSWRSLR
jgi:hypothetical protein